MTLQELQKQALQLPISDRWLLVQTLLESLQRETRSVSKTGNLSRLRGIAKTTEMLGGLATNGSPSVVTEVDARLLRSVSENLPRTNCDSLRDSYASRTEQCW